MPSKPAKVDRKRFRKVRNFFFWAFVRVFIWDVALNRPGLRWLRTDPHQRWRNIARDFARLATEMGGVLIKLGQFLSIRVDVIPAVITRELAGLRDRIPPDAFEEIKGRVEKDLNQPLSRVFPIFEEVPIGSASLAQVHKATLTSGEPVVVKVLRPHIEQLVETDMAATRLAFKWMKYYRPIARRVDLDWLYDEFATTTRAELDLVAEAGNIQRFADFFAEDASLAFTRCYPEVSGRSTLTMENVGFIKVDDLDGLDAAGIDRDAVAKALFAFYMTQLFDQHFVHADPHPGNIFVEPLPTEAEKRAGKTRFAPGENVPHAEHRPFRVVPIDFGMVADIPERLRKALREYAIGIATRDAYKVVRSYQLTGSLMPGADIDRLEEAHEDLFDIVWGVSMDRLADKAGDAFALMMNEYRDLLFETPFQVQVDLLFVIRGVEILNGVATNLNPKFNTWQALIPFAQELARREVLRGGKKWRKEAVDLVRLALEMPKRADRVLRQAERGKLNVRYSFAKDARKRIDRLEKRMARQERTLLIVGFLLAGTYAKVQGNPSHLGDVFLGLAGLLLIWRMFR